MRLRSKNRFRDVIELRRTNVRHLARKAGVPESLLWHLLRDPSYPTSRDTCTAPTAAAIERALDLDPGYLFEPEPLPVARHVTRGTGARRQRLGAVR